MRIITCIQEKYSVVIPYITIIGTKVNVNSDKLEALKYIITGPQNPYISNPL